MGRKSVQKQREKRKRQKRKKNKRQSEDVDVGNPPPLKKRKESSSDDSLGSPNRSPVTLPSDNCTVVLASPTTCMTHTAKKGTTSEESLGSSPTWPPPSPSNSSSPAVTCVSSPRRFDHINSENILSLGESNLLGYDDIVQCYIQDDKNDFEMEDGKYLSNEELLDYFRKMNMKLAEKATVYQVRSFRM